FVDQYVQYLLGNNAGVKDSVVFATRSCDFFVPLASNTTRVFDSYFTIPDGIEIDGSREGVLKDQNCAKPANKYIPTIAAANTSLTAAPKKLAVATGAVFKIPNLRNIELTGPFMHNGSLATLEQVVEFYARLGNVNNPNKNSFMNSISLTDPTQRAQLVEFLKTLTDDRVRYERAPFDHPEVFAPNGHPGNQTAATAGNPLNPNLAKDTLLVIPAVGANGSATPILPFEAYLAP
ncbi:MAG: cytochrome C peroxidase, partial [Candidatus Methylumidiphilus sp.]